MDFFSHKKNPSLHFKFLPFNMDNIFLQKKIIQLVNVFLIKHPPFFSTKKQPNQKSCPCHANVFYLHHRTKYRPSKFGMKFKVQQVVSVATPLWPSVEVKPNTSKVGDLESSGTPECLEFDSKAQNTSHWGVLGVIGKVLKPRYRKWPRIGHLDICSPSYGQKKGRESN